MWELVLSWDQEARVGAPFRDSHDVHDLYLSGILMRSGPHYFYLKKMMTDDLSDKPGNKTWVEYNDQHVNFTLRSLDEIAKGYIAGYDARAKNPTMEWRYPRFLIFEKRPAHIRHTRVPVGVSSIRALSEMIPPMWTVTQREESPDPKPESGLEMLESILRFGRWKTGEPYQTSEGIIDGVRFSPSSALWKLIQYRKMFEALNLDDHPMGDTPSLTEMFQTVYRLLRRSLDDYDDFRMKSGRPFIYVNEREADKARRLDHGVTAEAAESFESLEQFDQLHPPPQGAIRPGRSPPGGIPVAPVVVRGADSRHTFRLTPSPAPPSSSLFADIFVKPSVPSGDDDFQRATILSLETVKEDERRRLAQKREVGFQEQEAKDLAQALEASKRAKGTSSSSSPAYPKPVQEWLESDQFRKLPTSRQTRLLRYLEDGASLADVQKRAAL
jgi:hypothetical protein